MSQKKKRIIEATLYTLLGFGSAQAIRLASNLILTRLLIPEYFGIISIAMIFQNGLFFLSDIGLGPSIIRSRRSGDPQFLNTAWTIKSIRGLILFILIILITYPVARIYNTPELNMLLPVIAFSSIFQGLTSTSISLLQKKLDQKTIVIAEFIIQIIATGLGLIVAYLTKSIWSLVISGIVVSILKMIWSHCINESRHRFTLEKEATRELLSFGKWILFSTAIFYLAGQVDRFLLGKYFGMELFGIYNIALIFSELPKSVIDKISNSVIFPVLSEIRRDEIKQKIRKPRFYLLMATAVALALFSSFADYIILYLYDDRYRQAAWMLPLLFLGIWPRLLVLSIDRSLLAIGKPKSLAYGNLIKFIYMVIALPLFFHYWGALGAILAVTLNDIPLYATINISLYREKLSLIRQDLLITLFLFIVILIIISVRVFLGVGIPGMDVYYNRI